MEPWVHLLRNTAIELHFSGPGHLDKFLISKDLVAVPTDICITRGRQGWL